MPAFRAEDWEATSLQSPNLLDVSCLASLGGVTAADSHANRGPVILGVGGHAKVVIDVLREMGLEPSCCLAILPGREPCLGVPVRGEAEYLAGAQGSWDYIVAVGDNHARRAIDGRMRQAGGRPLSAMSRRSWIAPSADVGAGTLVMPSACVNADATLGSGVIVNTGAVVEHDCRLGDFVHIAPNAALAGSVTVGDEAMVGIGASILPGIRIGARAIVGAGSVVLADVPAGETVVGVPARAVQRR